MIKLDEKLEVRLTANETNNLNIKLKIQKAINSKNAIRDKFQLGNIAFADYANAISIDQPIQSITDYYKCVSVIKNTEQTQPEAPDFPQSTALPEEYLIISGCVQVSEVNGIYKQNNRDAVGHARSWSKFGGGPTLVGVPAENSYVIQYDSGESYKLVINGDSPVGNWTDALGHGEDNCKVEQYTEEYVYQFKIEGEAGNPNCLGEYTLEDISTMAGWRKWVNSNGKMCVNWLSPDTWYVYTMNEEFDLPCYGARVASPSTPPTDSSLTWKTAAATTPIPSVVLLKGNNGNTGNGGTSSSGNLTNVQTWNGKKLILITDSENTNKKYYDFSTEITSGLTCGTGYIPEIDEVYNADATIKATNLFVHVVEYSNDNVAEITELSNTLPIDDTNISNEPINNIPDEINNLTENFETILG